MGATLKIYNIATTGMYVNQAGLSVVSNNMSNVATTGFSRQQMVSSETIVSQADGTSYGCGSSMEKIYRARDSFLDQSYRQINGKAQYYSTKQSLLENAQKLLNEYSTSSSSTTASQNGLQQTIKNFFNSWSQLAKDSGSQSSRATVVEYAKALTDTFNQINTQLTEMQQNAANRVKDGVTSLNDLAKKVAMLNKQIAAVENGKSENGNLRDQRDALLDQMSSLANISVSEQANGALDVSIGGVALVQGNTTHTLKVVEENAVLEVGWAELGISASISSGSIRANLEEADQSGVTAITAAAYNFTTQSGSSIANLRQGLNDMVSTIVNQVNALLQTGKDYYGNTGIAMFETIDKNKPLELGNIQVSADISSDVNKIAAGTSGAVSDATVASAINGLQEKKIFSFDGLTMTNTDFYQSLISWISTTGSTASSNCDTQNALLQQASNRKSSVSSVSQDEEISKMIAYQNAYNASAKVLSTVDTLIGELISKLGS